MSRLPAAHVLGTNYAGTLHIPGSGDAVALRIAGRSMPPSSPGRALTPARHASAANYGVGRVLSTIQSSATRTHCSSRASSPSPCRLSPVLPPLRSWLLALKLAIPAPILGGATAPLGARPPIHSGAAPAVVWGHGPPRSIRGSRAWRTTQEHFTKKLD
ncbi:hypothetical protein DFH09DRAFT_1315382 [Mycena vulgaris]|nr:hypothetical protein DFH09DRAFT_1315382 [Mycena vulgaris]